MLNLLYQHQKVTVYASMTRRITLTFHSESHTVSHTGWYVETYHLLLALRAIAMAIGACLRYRLPFAVAMRTYRLALHRSKYGLLHLGYHSRTVTSATSSKRRAVLCPGAITMLALHLCGYLERL